MTALIEQLPANIPRLKPDGTNWAIFSIRFCEAMQATRRWGYFDGTTPCPSPKDPAEPTKDEIEAIKQWEREDLVTRYLLSQYLPDTTFMRLYKYSTAQLRWKHVNDEYTAKNACVQKNLEQAFFEMRCPKGADVRTFLTNLRYKGEELAAAGVYVTNKDYQRAILRGIPDELADFTSQVLLSVQLAKDVSTVDTDILIDHICEEDERLKNYCPRGQQNQGKNKQGCQTGEALAATGSAGGKKKRCKGKCHNCNKAGHRARECRTPTKMTGSTVTSCAGHESHH
jgi:gag-polypeptide of LTR copia-type/Zinc knuckle